MVFEGVIAALAASGVAGLYLPFLLLFAIFYALFTKTNIFGESKNVSVLLSFIFSLYIVAFSPVSGMIGLWFASFFATAGIFIVSVIVFFLVLAVMLAPWWGDLLKNKKGLYVIVPIAIVIAFLIVLGNAFGGVGAGGTITIPGLSSQDILFLALVIITILIIYWFTRPTKAGAGTKWELMPSFQ